MQLSHQVQGLSEDLLISCFIRSLRNTVRVELMAKQHKSVIETIRLARLEQEKVLMIKKPIKPSFSESSSNPSTTQSSQSKISCNSSSSNSVIPIKRLTSQEVKEKEMRVYVFHCDEKYTPSRKQKLLRLEILEEKDEDKEWGFADVDEGERTGPMVISLNAMTDLWGSVVLD